jgi:hypothetical protein
MIATTTFKISGATGNPKIDSGGFEAGKHTQSQSAIGNSKHIERATSPANLQLV